MKLGLIKKTAICVLSLSCLATLASCNLGSNSTTKVFANKDIQAYAKKKDDNYEIPAIDLYELKSSEKTLETNNFNYSLVKDNNTGKYQLYMRYANRIYDIPTAEGESVILVNGNNDLENSYGYFIISFSSGEEMAIDYEGNVVVPKGEKEIKIDSHRRIMDYEEVFTGDKTFYDFVEILTVDGTKEEIYKVDAKFEKGVVKSFNRTQVTSLDGFDYSTIEDSSLVSYKTKKYDFYKTSSSVYVKDLKGKLVSSFALNIPSAYYILDDKLIYQTSKTVTIDDDYTFFYDGEYYIQNTYQVDILTGKKKELKNFNYVIQSESSLKKVYGYNEKQDRTYVAGIYAILGKIENKQIALTGVTAMLDKNGKILSDKLGEKGTTLRYFDDKTYVLYENSFVSLINASGKVKASFNSTNNKLVINYYNKQLFLKSGSTGYFVDSNLKIISTDNALPYEIVTTFKNGNMLVKHNLDYLLVEIKDNELKVLDCFDRTGNVSPTNMLEGQRSIFTNDSLTFNNVYVVITKNGNNSKAEIYSVDGTLLKTINYLSTITNVSNQFFLTITTDDKNTETVDDTYYIAASYVNTKVHNAGSMA